MLLIGYIPRSTPTHAQSSTPPRHKKRAQRQTRRACQRPQQADVVVLRRCVVFLRSNQTGKKSVRGYNKAKTKKRPRSTVGQQGIGARVQGAPPAPPISLRLVLLLGKGVPPTVGVAFTDSSLACVVLLNGSNHHRQTVVFFERAAPDGACRRCCCCCAGMREARSPSKAWAYFSAWISVRLPPSHL